jgi:3-hydroxyisobutyrate dehydrogenase
MTNEGQGMRGSLKGTRVGWIGTGVMGTSMCGHLLHAGCDVTLTSRTRARALSLLDRGATWADTPADAASGAEVVFAMVGLPSDVREIALGPEGVLAASEPPRVFVDMTTSEPSLARAVHEAAGEKGVMSIDAPVSGGDVGARNATLSIMVGGEQAAVSTRRWSTRS